MAIPSDTPRPVAAPSHRGAAWLGAFGGLLAAGMVAATAIGTIRVPLANLLSLVLRGPGAGGLTGASRPPCSGTSGSRAS